MKKFKKVLLSGALAATACISLAACGSSDYKGEYKYENHGQTYGVKVEVVLSGDTIKEVKILDSDYVRVSPANEDYGWTEENVKNYTDSEAEFLKRFEGKKVSEVKAYRVSTASNGEPIADKVSAEGLTLISGATQSSGRLILAVQNALKNVK